MGLTLKRNQLKANKAIPIRKSDEGLTAYAARMAECYASHTTHDERKKKGQFFTPLSVASYMASLFDIRRENIRLLDPGAGVGMLLTAVCSRLCKKHSRMRIHIDAVENDSGVLPYLKAVLNECRMECRRKNHRLTYSILFDDFVLKYAPLVEEETLHFWGVEYEPYDFIISNPPYAKLNAESMQARAMRSIVNGQPNIYPFFMAISLKMLNARGQMTFITPRSFCSGLYYKCFRKWFVEKARIHHIHLFESRKHIFDHDGVLQENVILKVTPKSETCSRSMITVSTSLNRDFEGLRQHKVRYASVIHDMNRNTSLIAIPTTRKQISLQQYVNHWHDTLHDLGLEISTGPVVAFRSKKFLKADSTKNTVPLLWMHNMQGMQIKWEAEKAGKEPAIEVSDKTKPVLLPVKNYVLLKRFSSKEQNRRLYASVLLRRKVRHKFVGIENHLNYVHRPAGELSEDEAIGLAAFLNSSLADIVFRIINGNTQVNASDIRSMPFPPLGKLCEIAQAVTNERLHSCDALDPIVARTLGNENNIMSMISRR